MTPKRIVQVFNSKKIIDKEGKERKINDQIAYGFLHYLERTGIIQPIRPLSTHDGRAPFVYPIDEKAINALSSLLKELVKESREMVSKVAEEKHKYNELMAKRRERKLLSEQIRQLEAK